MKCSVDDALRAKLKTIKAGAGVTAKGSLFEADNGYHMTPILFDTSRVASDVVARYPKE